MAHTPSKYEQEPLFQNGVWQVLYSCHSSLNELREFVKRIKPKFMESIQCGGSTKIDEYLLKKESKFITKNSQFNSQEFIECSEEIKFIDYIKTDSKKVEIRNTKKEILECDYDPEDLLSSFETQESDDESPPKKKQKF